MASHETLRVIVRVRPSTGEEDATGDTGAVSVDENRVRISVPARSKSGEPKTFECAYDCALRAEATQDDVFARVAESVDAICMGINATIFAYGQTGTGKTYTMLGAGLEDELVYHTVTDEPDPRWCVMSENPIASMRLTFA